MISSHIDPSKIQEGPRAYLDDRNTLGHWAGQRIEKGEMDEYRQRMNSRSLDGCAGLTVARRQRGENLLLENCLIWLKRVMRQREAIVVGVLLGMVLALATSTLLEEIARRSIRMGM